MKKSTAAKTSAVAKPATHAKAPTRAALQQEVVKLQQQVAALGKKHAAAGKSKAAAKTASKHSASRGWSPDSDVALCAARAVAESLRIALSVPVSDEDVLALHWAAGGDVDAGLSILDALRAGEVWGGMAGLDSNQRPRISGGYAFGRLRLPHRALSVELPAIPDASLILGLDLPYGEPHAVVAHDGLWWSWGEPYQPADFPGAVIEEAWAVQWQ